jgi:hypothetical protein
MNKEVELTAKVTEGEFNKLRAYLSKNYTKTLKQERFMVRFFKDKVNVRESLDVRYKWTAGVNELVIKKGALGSQQRDEIIVNLGEKNQLEKFVNIFKLLGYKTGDAIYREIEKYQDEILEIALVKGYPYYFVEVESIAKKSKSSSLEDVLSFFRKIDLEPLNRSDYQAFQRLFDREVNLIFPLEKFPNPLFENPTWKKIVEETVFSK